MKINIIIPFIDKSGGIAVVLEHARRLREFGHDVAIYYPLLPYPALSHYASSPDPWRRFLLGRIKPLLFGLLKPRRRLEWSPFPAEARPVPFISNTFIRDADAVVATAWPTAYSVAGLGARKGRKFYFVQGFETWTPEPDKAEASYRLPLDLITISPWLTGIMRERIGRDVRAEVWNGVDLGRFSPPAGKDWSRPRILMMYSPLPLKGCAEGLQALRSVLRDHPETEITLFGMSPPPPDQVLGRFVANPDPERLVSLYREASIFLYPSRGEGWGLPILEAMACRCAVVATEAGCVPVLKEAGNLVTCPPLDADAMHRGMLALLEDANLCEETARKGFATAEKYDWDRMSRAFERALLSG